MEPRQSPVRDAQPASNDLVVLGVLDTAYSIFAFVGLGREPFLWALALGAAGFPLYWLMQRKRDA